MLEQKREDPLEHRSFTF